jgi:putative phosphoribosyl transferase
MHFRDRLDAAQKLTDSLALYRGRNPLVLAIPRGAVPMGEVMARGLEGELDVVLIRKIGLPYQPELAIGAVDEAGNLTTPADPALLGISPELLQELARPERARNAQRRAAWTPLRAPVDPRDRIAIVVDDGAATGATMVAALDSTRARGAARVIAAVPVASVEAAARIAEHADEVSILFTSASFFAVSQYYGDFAEVDDEAVAAILARSPTGVQSAGRVG